MQQREGRQVVCLDDEVLAAYVDGTLTAGEREAVETHLASCRRCFAIVTETARAVHEIADISTEAAHPEALETRRGTIAASVGPPRKRRRAMWAAATGAALAAALVLAIWWARPGSLPDASSGVAELVAAVGDERLIEPRLTGGFRHGPLRLTRGAGNARVSPDVRIAAARLEKALETDPTPAARAAFARAALLTGDTAAAVRELEAAIAADASPGYQSDLAAAFLLMADSSGTLEHAYVMRALDAASQAITREPRMTEALFNRALALERLSLRADAIAAWRAYVAVESDPEWREEGRRRLETLNEEGEAGTRSVASPDRVTFYGQAEREWQMVLCAGARAGGVRLQSLAQEYRAEAACTGVEAASVSISEHVVRGTIALFSARASLNNDRVPAARDAARESLALLPATLPALRSSALLVLATADFWDRDQVSGLRWLSALERESARSGDIVLQGEAAFLRGLWNWHMLRPAAAIEQLRRAERMFVEADGPFARVNAVGRARSALLRMMGASDAAWQALRPAMAASAATLRPLDRYLTLSAAALLALDERALHSALAFQNAAVEVLAPTGLEGPLVEALCSRAQTHAAMGDAVSAQTDLASARALLDTTDPYLSAEIALAESAIADRDPERSIATVTMALGLLKDREPPLRAALLHRRAVAHRRAVRASDAIADLDEALRWVRRNRRRLPSADQRLDYIDRQMAIVDEAVDLLLDDFNDPSRAFDYLQQGRNLEVSENLSTAAMKRATLSSVQQRLYPDVTLAAYLVREREVVTWVVSTDGVRTLRQPAERVRVMEAVATLRADPLAGGDAHRLLSRLLIEPLSSGGIGETVIVAPDDALAGLPFAALLVPESGERLFERAAVVVAPSLSALDVINHAPKAGAPRVLMVAGPADGGTLLPSLPRLRSSEREVADAASFYTQTIALRGPDASLERVIRELPDADIIHVAGHAVANDRVPGLSALVTAGDQPDAREMLTADLIANLDLSMVRLAILSACSTASGAARRGETAMSLARPFLSAGARSVLATLWDVDDDAAAAFMAHFHEHYSTSGDAAIALRRAQQDSLRDATRTPSKDWAAFVLIAREVIVPTGRSLEPTHGG